MSGMGVLCDTIHDHWWVRMHTGYWMTTWEQGEERWWRCQVCGEWREERVVTSKVADAND